MKINKLSLIFKKAPFPAVMTIIFFALFIGVYYFVTAKAVEPYYLKGLLFAVPFVCLGTIAVLTATGKLKGAASSVITAALIFASGAAMLAAFVLALLDPATGITTDIGDYKRVLRLAGYPDRPLTQCFPGEVPDNAEDVEFRYNPSFLQGGESIALKFETDSDSISGYIEEFSKRAEWVGKTDDSGAEDYGIFFGTFNILDYTYSGLPEDFTIYVIFSEPYRPDDWNHGERSLVAISRQSNEILFLADDW